MDSRLRGNDKNMNTNSKISTVDVLGVKVHRLAMPQALSAVTDLIRSKQNHYIVTPNPEMIMYAQKYPWFKEVINGASLSLADGAGIRWAAKYLSLPLIKIPVIKEIQDALQWTFTGAATIFFPSYLDVVPERITGADMVWEISKLASERDYRIFLLGAGPGVALTAARILQQMYPRLNVVEVMVGPPYESEDEVLRAIKQTKPQIIFLAFPAAGQMKWIRDVLPKLNDTIAMGIGGALDFIAGASAINAEATNDNPAVRAPIWMQNHGLEWLWRFFTQPWRKDRVKTATIDFMRQVRRSRLGH
jgi:N-acetylglucosaminyldiphosphoundecaprenol N-acetyl-beta-D-mannosaminyltransferase